MKTFLSLLLAFILTPVFSQGIVWENQGLTDEAVVMSGSSFTDDSGEYTVTLTWNTVSNGYVCSIVINL